MLNSILLGICIFIILFIFFVFGSLIYHEGLDRLKDIASLKLRSVSRSDIIFAFVFSLLLSGLLTYSVFI
jgi:hypothetical protein